MTESASIVQLLRQGASPKDTD
ncbi:MAG: hypothetical protein JWM86_2371, partial [Thermoleophilia bacterium]|nr:hypothetical protein [Thermoleophilia bacterium]